MQILFQIYQNFPCTKIFSTFHQIFPENFLNRLKAQRVKPTRLLTRQPFSPRKNITSSYCVLYAITLYVIRRVCMVFVYVYVGLHTFKLIGVQTANTFYRYLTIFFLFLLSIKGLNTNSGCVVFLPIQPLL